MIAVDYYNQWPFVSTREEFETSLSTFDQWGGPRGLERHREFAESQGLPFAVAEWSSNAAMGDSPVFMQGFFDWLDGHAGTGPGEVLYEILFNVGGYDEFAIFPVANQPLTSDTYRTLW